MREIRLGLGLGLVVRAQFQIRSGDIKGPLSLHHTIFSGQTAEPEWEEADSQYSFACEVDGAAAKVGLREGKLEDNFVLDVEVLSDSSKDGLSSKVKQRIVDCLRLRDDIDRFYEHYSKVEEDPILASTFPHMRGLRLMKAANLFESLICSISSQNTSVTLWNRNIKNLKKQYGRSFLAPDGTVSFLFPSPEDLAEVSPRELEKIGLAYRAKYVAAAAKIVREKELDLAGLTARSYEDAKEAVMQIPGVGSKVADCFLLYGVGCTEAAPVDVWIHRIASKLYFRGRRLSVERIGEFLRERFGDWAGYAQLYLFHYARKKWLNT